MKDSTRDRMSNWWWDWKPVVAIIAGVLFLASLAVAAVFIIGVKPNHPTYTRDGKTGLCFAHSRTLGVLGRWSTETLTNIPCTEAVLKEISAAKTKQ
jgi:hypothetical protein